MLEFLHYDFFQRALLGGLGASIIASTLGVLLILRRLSLVGEGLAHLSFGGVALGLYAGIYPLYTALLLAFLGTFIISHLQRKKIVYSETAIGIIISAGLAGAIVLVSLARGFNVDLFTYLFGSILTISPTDLKIIALLTLAVLTFTLTFYKELFLLTFNEEDATLAGLPTTTLNATFNLLVALAIIASIKIVGILLISSLLIIPGATALQIATSFKNTLILSTIFATTAVTLGMLISFNYNIATGGAIILVSLTLFTLTVTTKKMGG